MEVLAALTLVVALLGLLALGTWIAVALLSVGGLAMLLFSDRPIVSLMSAKIWDSSSAWALTALPLFIWMGEILFRSKLSESMFRGLAPWTGRIPGRLLHTNIVGCTIFAAISGSSAATCATIGKMTIPELQKRGYPDDLIFGSLAGAGTLGLLIPPSIIMIVYGITADVSIGKLFIAGIIPGLLLAGLFSGYVAGWSLLNPQRIPVDAERLSLFGKIAAGRHLIPVTLLIGCVLGSIYTGVATATESAALGVVGALLLSALQGSLNCERFQAALMGAVKLSCVIGFILAGAAFLTIAMGVTGLPRSLALWIDGLGLPAYGLIAALLVLYIVLGCFLDGISMVALTIAVLLPTIQRAGLDPIWFGIFVVIVVEMAQITPPVGFNLFVLQSMTGRQITYIARVALPFFLLMVFAVTLITVWPGIVTFLPERMIDP